MTVHFVNLTNGLHCCQVKDPHYLRIQSTWLEQKRFEDVLWTAGPDFLMHLARGERIVVHDMSERPRPTRALWQGLPWIRFACEIIWGGPVHSPIMRNGHNVREYFLSQVLGLSDRTKNYVGYFSKHRKSFLIEYDVCPRSMLGTPQKEAA